MTDDRTLVLTRHINASPATVWRCVTDPALFAQWFAPKPVEVFDVNIDLTPGGIFSFNMRMPEQTAMGGDAGCVLLVEDMARLVWTAALGPMFRPNPPHTNGDDFFMTADMSFTAQNGGTLYTARALHATPQDADAHRKMGFLDGWGTAADQLGDLAQTL